MEIILIILLVAVLCNLNIFFRLFVRENKSGAAYSFMYYSLFLTLWPFSMFCMNIKKPFISDAFFELVHPLIWIPTGFLTLWFVYEFLKKDKDEVFYTFLFLTLAILIIQPFTGIVQGKVYNSFIGRDLSVGPMFIPIITTLVMLPLMYSIILLRKHYNILSSGFLKKQVNVIFYTLFFCFGFSALLEIVIPNIIKLENTPNLTPVIIPFIVIIIFHSLRRYEFLLKDSDVILKQVFSIVKKGVFVLDEQENIIMKNRFAQRVLDIKPELWEKISSKGKKLGIEVIKENPLLVISFNIIKINETEYDAGKIVIMDEITEEYEKKKIIREKNNFLISRIENTNVKNESIEKEIKDIDRIYELIFNNDVEGMFVVDVDNDRIDEFNDRIIEIFNIQDEKDKEDFLLKEFHDLIEKSMNPAYKDKKEITVFKKRKDNEIFPAEFSFSGFSIEDSRYYLVCVRDLSQRLNSEKMLLQAERIAAIGSVAGGMAHEFNNLHTIISGNIELILKRFALSEEEKKNLDNVLSISRSISIKTKNILEFSRQEKYFYKIISLKKHIENIFEIIKRQCEDYGITINKDFPEDVKVRVIPGNITQIIMNMILFSINDLQDCSARNIYMSLKKEQGNVVFMIEDNGVLFELNNLQGLDETEKEVDEKKEIQDLILSGLGWKVSEMIAAENGGRLVYRKNENRNQFLLYLPEYMEEI